MAGDSKKGDEEIKFEKFDERKYVEESYRTFRAGFFIILTGILLGFVSWGIQMTKIPYSTSIAFIPYIVSLFMIKKLHVFFGMKPEEIKITTLVGNVFYLSISWVITWVILVNVPPPFPQYFPPPKVVSTPTPTPSP